MHLLFRTAGVGEQPHALAWGLGFEPRFFGFGDQYVTQLHYPHIFFLSNF